ncbi:MAG: hypothetical protein ACTHQM_07865 [Thermoanaerobaculia bacterium]
MDINSVYNGIAQFWRNIAPVLYAHVLFFIGIRWIAGLQLGLRDRLARWTQSDGYKKSKGLLEEFELWKKLPLLLIIGGLIYLTLMQDVVTLAGNLPVLRLSYSEDDFWRENKPVERLARIAVYASNPSLEVWEIRAFKEQLVDEYSAKTPDRYRRIVAWHNDDFENAMQHLRLALIYAIAVVIVAIWKRRHGELTKGKIARVALLLVLTFGFMLYARVRAELAIEGKLTGELSFVENELKLDKDRDSQRSYNAQQQQLNRADDSDIHRAEQRIATYYANASEPRTHLFWLARILERITWNDKPLLEREFPAVSQSEFRKRYR